MALRTAIIATAALGLSCPSAADNSDFQKTGVQPSVQSPAPTGPSLQGGSPDFVQQPKGNAEFQSNEFSRTNPNVELQEAPPASPAPATEGGGSRGSSDPKDNPVVSVHGADAHPNEAVTTFEGSVAEDDDVRENFITVVQDYVARKAGKGGYWAYRAKGGKSWRLKSVEADPSPVKKTEDGRWTGAATLRDVRNGRRLTLDFTVDFSGNWKVVSVKPHAKR